MKTYTTQEPVQIVDGYIPVASVRDYRINESLSIDVSDLHGSGKRLENGMHILLIESGHLPGAWIVEYSYDDEVGFSVERVYVAARLM